MCSAHNQYEAEHDYGRAAMSRHPVVTDLREERVGMM